MKPETAKIENVGKEGRSTKFGISLKKKNLFLSFSKLYSRKMDFWKLPVV